MTDEDVEAFWSEEAWEEHRAALIALTEQVIASISPRRKKILSRWRRQLQEIKELNYSEVTATINSSKD